MLDETNLGKLSKLQAAMEKMQKAVADTTKRINSFVERRRVSKHQAGKRGYRHAHTFKPAAAKRKTELIPTNHERVVAGRIKKDPTYLQGETK